MDRNNVFLCHASEDKESVVYPIYKLLTENGISCWLDEAEIQWGDSITKKVNEGLKNSDYVIVVLSETFIQKNWPNRELNAILNIEASQGKGRVLPVVIGDQCQVDNIINHYPLLNDILYIKWPGNEEAILSKFGITTKLKTQKEIKQKKQTDIPMPQIKKEFTQKDKDDFTKNTFKLLKEYFKEALITLESYYPEVQTSFDEVSVSSFSCTIYVNGEVKTGCVIQVSGEYDRNTINYAENRGLYSNTSSWNNRAKIAHDKYTLHWIDNMSFGSNSKMTEEQLAEHFWKKLTESL